MRHKKAIILFTRVPIAGQTKTRMMPDLTGKQCAKLHTCFLHDIYDICKQLSADVFVCYTPEDQKRRLEHIFGKRCRYIPQKEGSLGEKMYEAFRTVFQLGYRKCILMGTDIPQVQGKDLKIAFRMLNKRDVVFGRTLDGGYYLVGMKEPRKEVFEISSYGHQNVWEDTLRHLKKCGCSIGYTRTLADLDVPEDLEHYKDAMKKNKSLQKSKTARYLTSLQKISIIIPIYQEEKTIRSLQEQLKPLQDQCEIIFVDGGSTDHTLEWINPRFTVLHAGKGRAHQMNVGAKHSHGDILFFLHCDSQLPPNALHEIRAVMRTHSVGCFGIGFHSKQFFMLTCRIISNHRAKYRHILFGDQGIFIDRSLFFSLGMFPEITIMEDYQFSLTLKENQVIPGMTKHRIYTSERRFPKRNIPKLKVMWQMNRLRKMYRDGVAIEEIAKKYKDIR